MIEPLGDQDNGFAAFVHSLGYPIQENLTRNLQQGAQMKLVLVLVGFLTFILACGAETPNVTPIGTIAPTPTPTPRVIVATTPTPMPSSTPMPTMTPAPTQRVIAADTPVPTTTPEPTATRSQRLPLPLLQLPHQLLQLRQCRQHLLPHRHSLGVDRIRYSSAPRLTLRMLTMITGALPS